MKKVKITKNDIGRWVTVKWDDVGREDSILVDYDPSSVHKYAKVFSAHGSLHTITTDQIVEKRGFLNAA